MSIFCSCVRHVILLIVHGNQSIASAHTRCIMSVNVPDAEFKLGIAGASVFGTFTILLAIIFGTRCMRASRSEQKVYNEKLRVTKSTSRAKEASKNLSRKARKPLYVLMVAAIAMITAAVMYGLRIGGILTINIGTNSDPYYVYLSQYITFAVGGGLYMLSSMWVAETRLYQAAISSFLAMVAFFLIFGAEMFAYDKILVAQIFMYAGSALAALGAMGIIIFPINNLLTSLNGKRRKTSRRLVFLGLPSFSFFILWLLQIAGPIFGVDTLAQISINVIHITIFGLISLVFAFYFVLTLFKRFEVHEDNYKKTDGDMSLNGHSVGGSDYADYFVR